MLGFIREHRKLFMIIFVVCAIGLMVSMGLPGSSRGRGDRSFTDIFSFGSRAVAKIGKQEISRQELEEDIYRREEQFRKMFASQMNSEQGKKMYEQIRKSQLNPTRVLDELISRKIFYNLFEERGLQIAAGSVKNQIEQLPYFKTNGVFDAALYKKLVAAPHDFENNLRDGLKNQKVMEPFIFTGTLLVPGEMDVNRLLAKKRNFELLQINVKSFKKEVVVSEDEVQKIAADETKVNDLKTFYNRSLKNYKRPEEVSTKHILIPAEGDGETKIKEIQKDIQDKKITFEDAAKKYSKDPSNAAKGGEMGFFARGVMDKAFEAAAFALKEPGQISDVVKSSFGYHLIKLNEKKAAVEKSFQEVKLEVAREYAKDQGKLEAIKAMVTGWFKSKKGPDAAQLKSLGASWTKAEVWDIGKNRLGFLGEKDVSASELMKLTKENPLLRRPIELSNSVALVRFVSEKDDPVTLEEASYQKAVRITESYIAKYKKTLESENKIHRSEKMIAQVRKSMQLD